MAAEAGLLAEEVFGHVPGKYCECSVNYCLLFLLIVPLGVWAEEPQKLTLVEAQQAAIAHSERMSIAELQTLIAAEKIREIRGINYPKISADGSYSIRNNHLGSERKNPAYTKHPATAPALPWLPPPPPPPPQPKYLTTVVANKRVAQGKLSLTVPLYDFGYVFNLVGAQTAVVEELGYEKEGIRQELLNAVAVDMYRALEGAKLVSVILESIRVLEAQRDTSRDLYGVGLVTHNDVLVVEVQLAERQQELIQARHAIESALRSLSRLTGKEIASVEQIEDIQDVVSWGESVEEIIGQADREHPVLKKISASMTAAVRDYEATQVENYPDINAFVNLHTSSDSYVLHKNWVHGGVSIAIPIFDGGIVNSKLAQKRKHLSSLDLRYREAVEDIHVGIQKAFLQVDSAFCRIPVAQKSIALAEENLTISRDLFEEGLVTSDDVLNDESRLAQARSNYYQSLYDFYIAKSTLDYVAGRICIQGIEHVG